jgi:hypothetical protein
MSTTDTTRPTHVTTLTGSRHRLNTASDTHTYPNPVNEELSPMTRHRSLLGCVAIAIIIGLGLPSLTASASAGTA